jgi:signal transduction histidine kinase
MPRRKVRPAHTRIASGVTALVFFVVTACAAGIILVQLRISAGMARADFNSSAAAIATALQSGASVQRVLDAAPVASAKLYRASGETIAQSAHPEPPPNPLVRWLEPPEVDCRTFGDGLTLCLQPSTAALNDAVSRALIALLIVAAAALIAGILTGRIIARPYREMARLNASVDELRGQMNEREAMLRRRGTELEAVNRDMEAFAYSVSHDLRGPLGGIEGFAQALQLDFDDELSPEARDYVRWINDGCRQMRELIEGLLQMTRLARSEMSFDDVDLSAIARSVAESLQHASPERVARFVIRDGLRTSGDERLLRAVLENLMANAWKFTRTRAEAVIEVGRNDGTFFVRDNGVGFDPAHAAKMFRPFQRLHASKDFEGTGIGLATVQKILERHGGKAWAEGEVGRGATIYFTTSAEGAA